MCQRIGELSCAAPPGNAARRRQLYLSRRARFQHAPRCHPKCCRTTGQETEHPNSPLPEGFSSGTRGERHPMLQHKGRASGSARRKACGQERREQDAAGAGDSLGEQPRRRLSVRPPPHPRVPGSRRSRRDPGAVAAPLRLFGFWPAVPEQLRSDGNAETSAGAVGEAAGMSAGDVSSALNFKCHCTKSGDTGWGVNWPSH